MSIFEHKRLYISASKDKKVELMKLAETAYSRQMIVHRLDDCDLMISAGEHKDRDMQEEIHQAKELGIPVVYTDERLLSRELLNSLLDNTFQQEMASEREHIHTQEHEK